MSNLVTNYGPDWVADAIIYQIFPDRFCIGDDCKDRDKFELWGNPPTTNNFFGGDLQGIINKIEYLADLGINCLYLNPIFKANTNHRYDTVDYYEIDPILGSRETFRDLVEHLHTHQIRIILDGVFNHCSNQFQAFEHVRKNGESSKYLDWFNVRYFPVTEKPLNYDTCGGCYYLPKFNHQNKEVEDFLLGIAKYWLEEFQIDGWRLDTPQRMPKTFLKKFHQEVRDVSPNCYLVGELWNDAAQWTEGDIFDGCTNYPLKELIINFFHKHSLDAEDFSFELESLLSRLGSNSFAMMNLLGCHDTPRIRTIFNGEDASLTLAIMFQMTFSGIPLVYYGDEIGMTGGSDPDCRRTMEWDQRNWNRNLQKLYREMIKIRNEYKSLRRGTFQSLMTFDGLFVYKRQIEDEEFIVLLNPGPAVLKLHFPVQSNSSTWYDVYSPGDKYHAENGYLYFKEIRSNGSLLLSNYQRQ